MMDYKTICAKDSCTGCMACVNVCSKNAITVTDDIKSCNAVIDKNICINCGLCESVCPNNSVRELKSPILWKQGWAEEELRRTSSSGGAAAAVIKAFIES